MSPLTYALRACALVLVTLAVPGMATAEYPSSAVEYIIPFAEDGESDVAARILRPHFKALTGKDLVVLNEPGGGGTLQWGQLNGMEGDGHTVMGVNLPHIVYRPVHRNVGFETEDIVTVYFDHYSPDVILVRANSPFKTIDDLVEYARKRPGEFKFSGSGTGTSNHFAQIKFDRLTGLSTVYQPHKGAARALSALVRKDVDASWSYLTTATKLKGRLRVLAVATPERHPLFPDVPTFEESGIAMVGGAYRGIAVPDTTDDELCYAFSDIMDQIVALPEYQEAMTKVGFALTRVPYEDAEYFMDEKVDEYLLDARSARIIQ